MGTAVGSALVANELVKVGAVNVGLFELEPTRGAGVCLTSILLGALSLALLAAYWWRVGVDHEQSRQERSGSWDDAVGGPLHPDDAAARNVRPQPLAYRAPAAIVVIAALVVTVLSL